MSEFPALLVDNRIVGCHIGIIRPDSRCIPIDLSSFLSEQATPYSLEEAWEEECWVNVKNVGA